VANLASRLSTEAAAGQVLIGQRLCAAVEEAAETAPAVVLELKGFARPVAAYEVHGLR
jgi:class 3 adenylate cyclase